MSGALVVSGVVRAMVMEWEAEADVDEPIGGMEAAAISPDDVDGARRDRGLMQAVARARGVAGSGRDVVDDAHLEAVIGEPSF